MKRFKQVTGLKALDGSVVKVPLRTSGPNGTGEITEWGEKASDLINIILMNAPFKTQVDSKEGRRLAESIEASKGNDSLEIEESTHDWLKLIAEPLTPPIFRTNGHVVYEWIKEGFEKPNQPKGEYASKDKSPGATERD